MGRMQKIVQDAEYTVVEKNTGEIQPEIPTENLNKFDMDNVGEMVMVGRYLNGKEFVQTYKFNDALRAKAYCDYGWKYFDVLITRHIEKEIDGVI